MDFSDDGPVVDVTDKPIIDDLDLSDFENAAETVRRAGENALRAHLPDAYRIASEVTTPAMALNEARVVLAEILQTIPEPRLPEWLSVKQAAGYMGYSSNGLRKIVHRSKKGSKGRNIKFSQSRKGAAIKFKRAWLDEFMTEAKSEGVSRTKRRPKKARKTVETSHELDPSLVA